MFRFLETHSPSILKNYPDYQCSASGPQIAIAELRMAPVSLRNIPNAMGFIAPTSLLGHCIE
jgi:hypothetical protein